MGTKVESRLLRSLTGFYESWIIFIGLKMNLLSELARKAGYTPTSLAEKLNLGQEAVNRWVEAALVYGILERRNDTLVLPSELQRTLLDPKAADYRAGDIFYAVGRSICAAQLFSRFNPRKELPSISELVEEATRWEHNRIVQLVIPRALRHHLTSRLRVTQSRRSTQLRVLDVGCGRGGWILQFMKRYPQAQAVGVDPDGEAIRKAREYLKRFIDLGSVRLYIGEVQSLSRIGNFDLINCCEVLSAAKEPVSILRACLRLLEENGVLIVTEGLLHDSLPRRPDLSDKLTHGVHLDLLGLNGKLLTPKELASLFKAAGWQVHARIRIGARLWSYILTRHGEG